MPTTNLKVTRLPIRLLNRYTTLEDAIADARRYDTITLSKNLTIKNKSLIIDKHLTIDGGTNKKAIRLNQASIVIKPNCQVTLKNLIIVADTAIAVFLEKGGLQKLNISNCRIISLPKVDVRDWQPNVYTEEGAEVININNSTIDHLQVYTKTANIYKSSIGNYYTNQSILGVLDAKVNKSNLTNINVIMDNAEIINTSVKHNTSISSKNNTVFDNITLLRPNPKNHARRKGYNPNNPVASCVLEGAVTASRIQTKSEPGATYTDLITQGDITVKDSKLKNPLAETGTLTADDSSAWTINPNVKVIDPNHIATGQSDSYQKLQSLIGLNDIKTQLKTFISTAKIRAEQERRGLATDPDFSNHMVFAGPPGTGKTTVAKLLAKVLVEEQILKIDKVVIAGAKDLVSEYVGKTRKQTHDVIMSALGGILFIDEAYSLNSDGQGKSHNPEAIDQIVEDTMEYKGDLIIIMAGYDHEMKNLIDTANPGLKSRFSNWISFTPYSRDELLQIFDLHCQNAELIVDHNARQQVVDYLNQVPMTEYGVDGNGRFIENLLRDILVQRNNRLATVDLKNLSDNDLRTITENDVTKALI